MSWACCQLICLPVRLQCQKDFIESHPKLWTLRTLIRSRNRKWSRNCKEDKWLLIAHVPSRSFNQRWKKQPVVEGQRARSENHSACEWLIWDDGDTFASTRRPSAASCVNWERLGGELCCCWDFGPLQSHMIHKRALDQYFFSSFFIRKTNRRTNVEQGWWRERKKSFNGKQDLSSLPHESGLIGRRATSPLASIEIYATPGKWWNESRTINEKVNHFMHCVPDRRRKQAICHKQLRPLWRRPAMKVRKRDYSFALTFEKRGLREMLHTRGARD